MITSHYQPFNPYTFQFVTGITAGLIGGVYAYQFYGLIGKVKIHPFSQKGVACRYHIYTVPFGLLNVENGYIPVVDTLANHAVAGNINGSEVLGKKSAGETFALRFTEVVL